MDKFDAQQEAERNRFLAVEQQRADLYNQLAALRIKYDSAASKAKRSDLWDEMVKCKTSLNALDLIR